MRIALGFYAGKLRKRELLSSEVYDRIACKAGAIVNHLDAAFQQ